MSRVALPVLLTLALGLSACVTATPYQPLASSSAVSGGYSEQRLDDSHFRVTFKGNEATTRGEVETYLLYRAAELTVQQGGDWFEMADKQTHDTGRTWVEPSFGPAFGPSWRYWRPSWRFYGRWGFGPWDDPWMDDFDVVHEAAYEASTVIAIGRGPKPADDPRAFEARQVMQNLGPNIVRPK